ncbi:hypothetical protein EZV62_007272 [Acer yangbiense]|uniref:phosphoribosylaminoimidazole carboxylase n=1 Tax=Acer yangbiense TaxID=1000413 RepID=A0A5C7IA00_9ROSI|nr:hypothetical protein EZV62_007272 [Acer yangbiense]
MLQSSKTGVFSKNPESVFAFKPSFHRKPHTLNFYMDKQHTKSRQNPILVCRARRDSHKISCVSKDDSPVHGVSEMVLRVLGGGQLGRMLCQAASKMAIKVVILDPLENCPASALSYDHDRCGVLTVEIEHVDVATLEELEQQGVDFHPKASTIRIIQDKYLQKVHFSRHGIPLPEFMQIDDFEGARRAGDLFGYPLMIKSKRLAYDGRGNVVAKSEEELSSAVTALGGFGHGLYVEKWAPFVKELAVIVAILSCAILLLKQFTSKMRFSITFKIEEYEIQENICHIVKSPAVVPWKIRKLATDVAYRAVSSLEGAGVFAAELFLTEDGQILLNEVAPRPHNSGHHTIESCYTSQYEQHLRAVVGLPLGDPSMKTPAAIMYNLLGEDEGDHGFYLAHQLIGRALGIPGATVHWYDKPEMRKQRKMGHITIVGSSMGIVEARLNSMLKEDSSDSQSEGFQIMIKVFPSRTLEDLVPELLGIRNVVVRSLTVQLDHSNTVVLLDFAPRVGIIMGSDSDLPVMKEAARILSMFGVSHEVRIVSAHRTPAMMFSYALSAEERGVQIIIAGAGGMVAALTPLPVIGVPMRASALDGIDSLLSIVQMPRGVPVATVAINNATNAGLLAVRMLGVADADLVARMSQYLEDTRDEV